MTQEEYNQWVIDTSINKQMSLCGEDMITKSEEYFIQRYCKNSILDIGCNTGYRTFPVWENLKCNFCGIEKFPHIIQASKYKEHIIEGDISSNTFHEVIRKAFKKLGLNEEDKVAFSGLFGGVINGLLDKEIRKRAWLNLGKLSQRSHYILVDNVSDFDFYENDLEGQVIKLSNAIPHQYFYSKKEINQLIRENDMEIVEEKTEIFWHVQTTYYLLTRKGLNNK